MQQNKAATNNAATTAEVTTAKDLAKQDLPETIVIEGKGSEQPFAVPEHMIGLEGVTKQTLTPKERGIR